MIDHTSEAMQMLHGLPEDCLDHNRQLELSITRLLEIIGEAANRLPKNIQDQFPDLSWAGIIGLRNRLIHGYESVDNDIVWNVVTHDLPKLLQTLKQIQNHL